MMATTCSVSPVGTGGSAHSRRLAAVVAGCWQIISPAWITRSPGPKRCSPKQTFTSNGRIRSQRVDQACRRASHSRQPTDPAGWLLQERRPSTQDHYAPGGGSQPPRAGELPQRVAERCDPGDADRQQGFQTPASSAAAIQAGRLPGFSGFMVAGAFTEGLATLY